MKKMKEKNTKRFNLSKDNVPSLVKSGAICALAVAAMYLLTILFPNHDFSTEMTVMLTAISAWLVNLVRVWAQDK